MAVPPPAPAPKSRDTAISDHRVNRGERKFIHIAGTDYYYDVQVKVAEKLAEIAPLWWRASQGLSDQLRHRSCRGCNQVTLVHRTPSYHRFLRRVSRAYNGVTH